MTNLITNPGFETDTTGWDTNSSTWVIGGATLTRITTDSYAGTACGAVTYPSIASQQSGINVRSMAFQPGIVYRASAVVKVVSGRQIRLRVRDWNNGTPVQASSALTFSASWTTVEVYFTTGASAGTHINNTLSIVTDSISAAGEFRVDEVTLGPVDSGGILL
jgi:hypothetical protein